MDIQTIDDLIDKTGITHTALRPMGRVDINGITFEAKTNGEFVDKGAKIIVLRIENQYLLVKGI